MNGRPIAGAVLIIILAFGQPVLAVTEVPSSIEGDTIWTKENGPYYVNGQVNFSAATPGSTLTIGPGTVVEFVDHATINVFGDLVVNGTDEEPVVFGSAFDSTLRNWEVLLFDSLNSSVNHLHTNSTRYALMVFDGQASLNELQLTDSDLLFDNSTVSVHNSVLEGGSLLSFDTGLTAGNININGSAGTSLISDAGSLIASGIYISNGQSGVNISGDNMANLSGLHVSNVDGPALNISQSTVSVSNSSFSTGKNVGLGISGDSIVDLSSVSVSNFMAPGIALDGSSLDIYDLESMGNLIGIAASNSNMNIDRAVIKDNTLFGIDHSGGGNVKIGQSRFNNNGMAGVSGNGTETVDATGNYWGHPGGPTLDPMNPEAVRLGDGVIGNVAYEPWISEYCESECYSNVMFLPGIMSSRLYKDDEQLWEPGTFTRDEEFSPLYLDENGKSIDPEIYTKDVLDNGYAYGKLVEDLSELKTSGTINDYEAVPYDWRLSMEDVLNTGTKRDDGSIIYGTSTDEPYIESSLRRLAANSKSGKVTIIAHSNGGLVTKALINKLGEESKGLIDKIIFVGVPQLGTPQAIGSLLHGYNAGLPEIYPFVLSPERARDLALNMPMIYQLMPFADYYNGEGASVGTPYVTFEEGRATQAFIDRYGYAITPNELVDFLNGAEGRNQVAYDDLNNAVRANSVLLADALEMQASIDSNWDVPEGIEMHQVAGTGEETLAKIIYKTISDCIEYDVSFKCLRYKDKFSYSPKSVVDGDGTVVAPSALAMTDSEAKRWWVNLYSNNIDNFRFGPLKHKHADILEIDELRDFLFENLVFEQAHTIPKYISSSIPEIDGDRLSFTLHSPLSLSAVDTQGNIVNAKTSTIPGAEYQRYGEVQVLTIPIGTKFSIVLNGEAEGSFTLEMEEWEDDELVATSTLSAIPSSTSTIATISFTDGSLEDMGILEIDYNGDSIVDLTYTPEVGETVFTPDLPNIDNTSPSGGRRASKGQVLGASTDLIETLRKVQMVLNVLLTLKGHMPDENYIEIENRVREILHTLITQDLSLKGI